VRLKYFLIIGLVTFVIGLGLSFQNTFETPSQTLTGSNSDLKPDSKLLSGNEEPTIATHDSITSDNKPQKDLDSIPFRYLPWSEQLKKSQPYHEYGALTLKRYDPEPTHYSTKNAEQGYMVIENYPGVLHYRYLPFQGELKRPYNCFRLEFYNPASKALMKSVNLIDSSPYNNDRYPILGLGYPAEEDFNWEHWAAIYPDGQQAFYDRLNQNEKCYLTVNNVTALPNGYTIVEHQLIEMSRAGGPFGWEETLVIYDNLGNPTSTYTTNHDIVATWVSDNGRFLAYVYGGPDSSNPKENNHGGLEIYDLKEDKLVYQKSNKEEQVMFSRIGMDNLNYLDIPASEMVSVGIHSSNSDAHKVIFLIDFNNRSIYKTKVDKAQYLPLRTKPADSLLKRLPFTREPFSRTNLGNSTSPRDFFRTGSYIQEHNRMGVTKLEFVDERNGVVDKEANLVELSPFLEILNTKEKLKHSKTGLVPNSVQRLDKSGIAFVKNFVEDTTILSRIDKGILLGFLGEEISAETPGDPKRKNRNTVATSHTLYLMECFTADCRSYDAFLILAEHRIFNKRGEVIATFRTSKGSCSGAPIITGNDKWMAVHYGGALGPDLYWPEGLLIYDLNRKKPAFHAAFKTALVQPVFPTEEYFVSKRRIKDTVNIEIYHPEQESKFFKSYCTRNTYTSGSIEDYKKDGVLFYPQGQPYLPGENGGKKRFMEHFKATRLEKL
jgi:hypothetical protein